jgi:hypothetical protein
MAKSKPKSKRIRRRSRRQGLGSVGAAEGAGRALLIAEDRAAEVETDVAAGRCISATRNLIAANRAYGAALSRANAGGFRHAVTETTATRKDIDRADKAFRLGCIIPSRALAGR